MSLLQALDSSSRTEAEIKEQERKQAEQLHTQSQRIEGYRMWLGLTETQNLLQWLQAEKERLDDAITSAAMLAPSGEVEHNIRTAAVSRKAVIDLTNAIKNGPVKVFVNQQQQHQQ